MSFAKLRPRRGTKTEWLEFNPILMEGELGIEYPDTGIGTGLCKFKLGDGYSKWSELVYAFSAENATSMDGGTVTVWNNMQVRRGTTDEWELADPVLAAGEIVFDITKGAIKVGDGEHTFNALDYIGYDWEMDKEYDFGDMNEGEIVPGPDDKDYDFGDMGGWGRDWSPDDGEEPDPSPDPEPEPEPDPDVPFTNITVINDYSSEPLNYTAGSTSSMARFTITQPGTYTISNEEDTTESGVEIFVNANNVTLNISSIIINNSDYNVNSGIIRFGNEASTNATINLIADTLLTGSAGTGNVIEALNETCNLKFTGDGVATLRISGNTNNKIGIYSAGSITFDDGFVSNITTNNEAVKAAFDITFNSGSNVTISNSNGNAIESVSGKVDVNTDTTINVLQSGNNAIQASSEFNMFGGYLNIANCEGDGIKAESANILDGTLNISNTFSRAATNFYSTSLSPHNTISKNGTITTEVINVNTGTHHGLNIGTEAKKYSYESVNPDSGKDTGTTYTQNASGTLNIEGGDININTVNTGFKYDISNDVVRIIGSPGDGIRANNICTIENAKITINASGVGISALTSLDISKESTVTISVAYRDIQSPKIIVGTDTDLVNPVINGISLGNSILAAKDSIEYVYTDETEETYTKTYSSLSGSAIDLDVKGGDITSQLYEGTRTVVLENKGSTPVTYAANAIGDVIKSYGNITLDNGKFHIFGASDNYIPINAVEDFIIDSKAVIYASATTENQMTPDLSDNGYVEFTDISLDIEDELRVTDSTGTETLYNMTMPKSATYVFFTSNNITAGDTYKIYVDTTEKASAVAS